jgi:SNF2 family DNA or RNA helicase
MEILRAQLDVWCKEGNFHTPLTLHSGLDGNDRTKLVENFKNNPNARILIASTLAAGEGLNLQFCSDAVLLERQWNPANEEQVEGRFHRFGQLNNVSITYMLASGTIDEFFTELVEIKRSIVAATLDKKEIAWNQQSLMKELAEILVTRGKKAWTL